MNLEAGEYTVNVSYGGNENFTGNSTTQNLTIEQEVVETNTEPRSSQTQSSGGSGESVVVESVDKESGVVEGYKGGRKGVWTPTGNFIAEGGS